MVEHDRDEAQAAIRVWFCNECGTPYCKSERCVKCDGFPYPKEKAYNYKAKRVVGRVSMRILSTGAFLKDFSASDMAEMTGLSRYTVENAIRRIVSPYPRRVDRQGNEYFAERVGNGVFRVRVKKNAHPCAPFDDA